jgi:adenylate cyclase
MTATAIIPWRLVGLLANRVRLALADVRGALRRPVAGEPGHEAELARQTLRGEQRRLAILAPLLTGMTLLVVAFGVAGWWRGVLVSGYVWILAVGVLACTYEWTALRYLTHAVERGFQPDRFRFYLNALVEIAAPMAMALIAAAHTDPTTAVSGPASYVYFLFIILSALRLDFALSLFTGAVCSLAYGVTVVLYWAELERAFPLPGLTMQFSFFVRALIFLLAGWVAGLVSVRLRASLVETVETLRERERVVALFGQHVSPAVVDRLLTGAAGQHSEVRTVCVLVLDIRNFTGFSEQHPPEQVVALLNRLWGFMVRAVNDHHGFVNKFLGDGFLAVFGAPLSSGNDCQNAVAAARRILRELDGLVSSGVLPPVDVGMAVHAGDAIVGNIGSAERREYTVIGDVVNVAFRLEALNKDFGSRLLVSDRVRREVAAGNGEQGTTVQVRGRDGTLAVHSMG